MDSIIKKLQAFVTEPECAPFLDIACSSFFEEFAEEHGFSDVKGVMAAIGEPACTHISPCMLEYFVANEYEDHSRGHTTHWNAIDLFLKKRNASLTAQEKGFLRALRQSHMSLYEVVDIQPDMSLTLRDLIEDKPLVVVSETALTRCVAPLDIVGVRLCHEKHRITLGAGCLPITRDSAVETAHMIRFLHKQSMDMLRSGPFASSSHYTPKKIEALCRAVWVKEIALAYLRDAYHRQHRKV